MESNDGVARVSKSWLGEIKAHGRCGAAATLGLSMTVEFMPPDDPLWLELETPDDWAEGIARVASGKQVITRRLANTVYAAWVHLKYGKWKQVWKSEKRPFGKAKADRLVPVGLNLGPLDDSIWRQLPFALNALYHVAWLPRAILIELIRDDTVKNNLTERAAKALRYKYTGKPEPQEIRFDVKRIFAQVHKLWSAVQEEGAPAERAFLDEAILDMLASSQSAGSHPGLQHAA